MLALLTLLTADAAEPKSWSTLWSNLGETEERCGSYDYHPGGGMRSFYCHMLSQISYEELQALSPHPIFLSGPHTAAALKLDDAKSFGHYSPEFVQWLGQSAIPGADSPALRAATQPLYDTYVAPLARIHYQTWRKLNAPENAECTEREKAGYVRFMETGQGVEWGAYYERWFFYMNPAFCSHKGPSDWYYDNGFDGGVSGNVVKTTVGFWLRRSLDGTDDDFYAALVRLLETYDAAWLSAQMRQ